MTTLRELPGLGPKSEQWLIQAGISNPEQLRALGAMEAFSRLKATMAKPPGLNFLYALVGALENRDWKDIAQNEKARLLMELEGYQALEALFNQNDR